MPAQTFHALQAKIPSLAHVISVGPPSAGTLAFQQLVDAGPFEDIRDPGVAADPAILCFTSGTSAAPKAVVHSSYTMLANNRLCASLYDLRADDVVLTCRHCLSRS
jgi:acyl-coenzyme A synthetase/AMP-(fatty) acid ligase